MEMGKSVHWEMNGCIRCFGSHLEPSEAAAPEVLTYIKQFLTQSQYPDSPYSVCVNLLFPA